MTTQEVANKLIQLCQNGEFVKAEQELYGSNIVHIEANGEEFNGFEVVLLKEKQFLEKLEKKPVVKVSEPIVTNDFFTIGMHMEFIHKELGSKIIDEIIVYKVNKGKIVYLKCYF
jgi:hypothetical protein